jgi:AbrB family looped-hinge helix DNA binding protein
MNAIATITAKGQITIPKRVRKILCVGQGDRIEFDIEHGKVELRTVRPSLASAGVLKRFLPKNRKAITVADMDAAMGQALSRKYYEA